MFSNPVLIILITHTSHKFETRFYLTKTNIQNHRQLPHPDLVRELEGEPVHPEEDEVELVVARVEEEVTVITP